MSSEPLSYDRPQQAVPEDSRQVKCYQLVNRKGAFTTSHLNDQIDSSYRRSVERMLPTRLYIIISGGERKERHYFSNLGSIVPIGCSIPLYFVCPIGRKSGKVHSSHSGSSPKDLFDYWSTSYHAQTNTLSLSGRTYHLDEDDRVYLVSDLDEFYEELHPLLKAPTHPCIRWAISNPCIEVWLYYSCIGKPSKEHYQLLEKESVAHRSQELKKLCNKVVKGGLDPRKAPERIEEAISNAISFGYEEDKQGIPTLFRSSMLCFAREFVEYISRFKG